jgi:hypothetical protein
MAKKTMVICDKCRKEINTVETSDTPEEWIDAGAYGVEIHVECLESMKVKNVLKLLGLDDIRLMQTDGEAPKYIYQGN